MTQDSKVYCPVAIAAVRSAAYPRDVTLGKARLGLSGIGWPKAITSDWDLPCVLNSCVLSSCVSGLLCFRFLCRDPQSRRRSRIIIALDCCCRWWSVILESMLSIHATHSSGRIILCYRISTRNLTWCNAVGEPRRQSHLMRSGVCVVFLCAKRCDMLNVCHHHLHDYDDDGMYIQLWYMQ